VDKDVVADAEWHDEGVSYTQDGTRNVGQAVSDDEMSVVNAGKAPPSQRYGPSVGINEEKQSQKKRFPLSLYVTLRVRLVRNFGKSNSLYAMPL